ncbi:MAG: iron-sulfur cluster assembly accessory protein [Gammaproteobacteria bacterium]|nr:iron-sulfur cluster assembly accessory protein [Gammaproteobacteria bacterium]
MSEASVQSGGPTFTTELRESDIAITDTAREALAGLLEEAREEDSVEAVRVYVSGGGCGGMTYGMTFTDQSTPFDRIYDRDGLRLYVDAVALGYLQGAEIDYVEQAMGATFVFRNAFQAVGGTGACSACGAAGGGCA